MLPNVVFVLLVGLIVGLVSTEFGLGVGLAASLLAGLVVVRHHSCDRRLRLRLEAGAVIALAVVVGALLVTSAKAAEPAGPAEISLVAEALRPIVELVVGAAVTAFLGWLYAKLNVSFGLDLDAKHRATLQSALTTAANLVVAQAAKTGQIRISEGLKYLAAGAPDAIAHFGVGKPGLEDMLTASIQREASKLTVLAPPDAAAAPEVKG